MVIGALSVPFAFTASGFAKVLMRADNVNGLVFIGNTVDIGSFFDKTNIQGRIQMYKHCSNITCSDNNFINCGFLDNKKIIRTDSISVWAEVNSQL